MRENELPSWLNEAYFRTLLRLKDSTAALTNYDIKPAVQGGNNYCSRMWRVRLEYTTNETDKSLSIMVKANVPDGVQKQFLDESKFVHSEFMFYNEMLPKMYKMTDNLTIFPKSYPSTIPMTIALEDLSEQGYRMCERLNKLDFEHCRLVMETIGEFHALSVAVSKQEPEIFEKVGQEGFFIKENKTSGIFNLCKQSLIGFSNQIKNWEGFERFGYISKDKLDTFYDKTVELFSSSKNLNVLNHGDLWTNNILFRYDMTGKVIDAKLVDFQLCRKGSPGIDLHYFTWTSMTDDVRENRLEELYEIYLDTLNFKLKELECEERLTKEQFNEEMMATSFYGFFILCVMLPYFLGDPDHPVEMDVLLDSKIKEENKMASMAKAYRSKYYNEVAPKILLHLEDTVYENLGKS